jgi:circadian clock protein KaiC
MDYRNEFGLLGKPSPFSLVRLTKLVMSNEQLQEQHQAQRKGSEDRVPTGIAGLDPLIQGGLPSRSLIVLGGRPGTGKTLLGARFLYEGASNGEPSIYVSFAENKIQFLSNMRKFGLDFQKLIDRGTFEFIDLTTVSAEAVSDALNLVLNRVAEMRAKRLVVDSFTAIAQAFEKLIDARIALHVILGRLVREEGCTTLLLVEMPYGTERIGLGIEEFVADGIITLDSIPHKGGYLRTISVKKMRGTQIKLDQSTYDISSENGFEVFPALELGIEPGLGINRVSTKILGFDDMTEGGFPERSVTTLVGAAGTGKTTFALQYVYNGANENQENGLFIAFGEASDQLQLVGKKLGMDRLDELIYSGRLTLVGILPESTSIEAHAANIERLISKTNARRVVFDDVTALQSICTDEEFYFLLKKITQIAKSHDATTLMTITTSELAGTAVTGMGLSTVMDSVILMRYVEVNGKMDRTIIVLKMRGTKHDNTIKKFSIGTGGIAVEGSFVGYSGVLTGMARLSISEFEESERKIAEKERLDRIKRRQAFDDKMRDEHQK